MSKKINKRILSYTVTAALGGTCMLTSCKTNTSSDAKSTTAPSGELNKFDAMRDKLLQLNKEGSHTGAEKLETMWQTVKDTAQAEGSLVDPAGKIDEIIAFGHGTVHRFWRIFTGFTDSMANNNGSSEVRPNNDPDNKYVRQTHRYAAVAKMRFVVDKEAVTALGYTGQYATGSESILGRVSSAVPTSVAARFTPAVSMKFFTGGANESQVLIVQHDIGGQNGEKLDANNNNTNRGGDQSVGNNFYTRYLSNRLSFENGVLSGVGAFSRFFFTAQYFGAKALGRSTAVDPRELSANHLAELNVDGTQVANARGPRFVWFVAPAGKKEEFAKLAAAGTDLRKHFMSYNSQIASAPVTFFDVYASDIWTYQPEQEAKKIGHVDATSAFVSSEAADVRLFFKHSVNWVPLDPAEVPAFAASKGWTKPEAKQYYTEDFPMEKWAYITDKPGDFSLVNYGANREAQTTAVQKELFTGACRVGVTYIDVVNQNDGGPAAETDITGDFIQNLVFHRTDATGLLCVPSIVKTKVDEATAQAIQKAADFKAKVMNAILPGL